MKAFAAALLLSACLASPARGDDLNHNMSAFPKWERVTQAVGEVKVIDRPGQNKAAVLRAVHQKYASVKYIEDMDNAGIAAGRRALGQSPYFVKDYWQTPEEFRANGGGDCEDFAIAKYFDLLALGFKDSEMMIVVGLLKKTQELHAVLRVTVDGQEYILDSFYPDEVKEGEHMRKIMEFYEINRQGWRDLQGQR